MKTFLAPVLGVLLLVLLYLVPLLWSVWSPGASCDFEEGLCEWNLDSLSPLKWVRTSQEQISLSDPLQGPGRDHSNNRVTGVNQL